MTSRVHHLALAPADNPLAEYVTPGQLESVVCAAGNERSGGKPWAIKVQVAPPGLPAWIKPGWMRETCRALDCGPGSFACDTVSITTRGLEDPLLLQQQARRQGFEIHQGGLPFKVADEAEYAGMDPDARASALASVAALAVLTPLKPHPHLGFQGVLADVGLGLLPRAGKLALHRDIRPRVDTPLCAGCGSCLDVCLYDAIAIQAGRAYIDHRECTGCGECMTVCFMAGIAPDEAERILGFQQGVARSAAKVLENIPAGGVFLNLLVGLDRFVAGPGKRMALVLNRGHLLAGRDPVAVDQAAWDLLEDACAGSLKNWHGYHQDPEALLAAAAQLGLGSRKYQLHSV